MAAFTIGPFEYLAYSEGGDPADTLENVSIGGIPDGAICFVKSTGSIYALDRSSSSVAGYPQVVDAPGGGQWVATQLSDNYAKKSSAAVTVPIGATYTTLLSIAAPVSDGKSIMIGTRIWHKATGGVRYGEDFRFILERSGSNYRLTTSDTSVTSVGATPSITDTLDSNVGWRARVASGVLYIEQLQYATAETSEAYIWTSEQSSV